MCTLFNLLNLINYIPCDSIVYERATFTVNKGTAVISFSHENSAALGSEIELVGNLKPQLAEQTISLKIIKPDGSVPTPTNIQTGELLH